MSRSTEEMLRELDPEAQAAVQRTADRELARGSVAGAPVYLALLIVLTLVTGYGRDHPFVVWGTACALAGLGAWRIPLAIQIRKGLEPGRIFEKRNFAVGSLLVATYLLAAIWSAFTCVTLVLYPDVATDGWTPLLTMLMTTGIVAGASTTYASQPKLAIRYICIVLVPSIVTCVVLGGVDNFGIAVVTAIYMIYLTLQAVHVSKWYWTSLIDQERLVGRTRDLELAEQEARELGSVKSRFLTHMSHEIRTPLNAIIGLTDEVPEGREEVEASIRRIGHAGNYLLALVDNLVDLSELESGKLTMDPQLYSIRAIVEQVAGLLAPMAHENGVELAVRVDPFVPRVLIGDPGQIRKVLFAVIDNAVHFTHAGSVEVEVTSGEPSHGAVPIQMRIEDTGEGIAPDRLQVIFESFAQGDESNTRSHGGAGLGLTIAAGIVSRMGGKIGVQSELGQGSRFLIELECELGESDPGLESRTRLTGAPILIAESHPLHRKSLCETLSGAGLDPIPVENESEVRRHLEESRNGSTLPRLLISDTFDGRDGIDLASRLRAEGTKAQVFVGLTHFGREVKLHRAEAAKVKGHLAKPYLASELLSVIGGAVQEGSFDAMPALKILLAEDNRLNQMVLVRNLERDNHEVRVTDNGQEALEALAEESFDLVLTDLQMPVVDGFGLAREIRNRESAGGGRTPVIAVSAHVLHGEKERCREVGMDGFVSKPIRNDELRQAILRAMQSSGGGDTPLSMPPDPSSGEDAA